MMLTLFWKIHRLINYDLVCSTPKTYAQGLHFVVFYCVFVFFSILPTSIRVTSLALGQSYACPCVSIQT